MTTHTDAPPTQVYRVFIKATAERIWEALTTPELTARYFHGAQISIAGGRYVSTGTDGSTWADEELIEADPPRRLVHGWRSMYDPEMAAEPSSRVTWELEPGENGVTLLTITHDRLEDSPKTAGSVYGPGWSFVISGLKTLLETGEPLAG